MKKVLIIFLTLTAIFIGGCKNEKATTPNEATKVDINLSTESKEIRIDDSEELNKEFEDEEKNVEQTAQEKLLNLISELGYDDTSRYSISYKDLNNDNIPEVFVVDLEDACYYEYVYTYYDNSLNEIGCLGGVDSDEIENVENSPYFINSAFSSAYQYECIGTIKDGNVVDVASICISNMPESMEDGFVPIYEASIDGNIVSVDDFWNYLSSILPSDTVVTLKECMMDDNDYYE